MYIMRLFPLDYMPEWAREAVARLATLARVPAALGRKNENLTSEKANYPRCSRRSSRSFDWRRLAGYRQDILWPRARSLCQNLDVELRCCCGCCFAKIVHVYCFLVTSELEVDLVATESSTPRLWQRQTTDTNKLKYCLLLHATLLLITRNL